MLIYFYAVCHESLTVCGTLYYSLVDQVIVEGIRFGSKLNIMPWPGLDHGVLIPNSSLLISEPLCFSLLTLNTTTSVCIFSILFSDSNNVCNNQVLFLVGGHFFNPLNPKSDQHLISPYNIIPESHIEVVRITEMITNERSF